MPTDDRITAYIAARADFAQPILNHLRGLIHAHVPEASETIKWGMPFFEWRGRPLAMMAAFKGHAGIGLFDGSPMASGEGMGNLGKLTGLADLPSDADLIARLRKAVALIAAGGGGMRQSAPALRPPKADIPMPDDLAAALAANDAAARNFAGFPPGCRREYLDWVTSAKQPATRAKRIETTVAQAAEGKRLNWKYEKC